MTDASSKTFSGEGLQVVNLRKSFVSPTGDRIEVLRGLSLSIEPGEAVAIMGASGSGKSTLLHLIGGLDEADHGSISLDHQEITKLTSQDTANFRQTRMAFVFQFHYLLSDLTALENVALPLLIQRQAHQTAYDKAKAILVNMGLEDRADHRVTHLAGGEQQRVAVARALVTEPTLILADEPTGNLDTQITQEIAKTLTNYAANHSGLAIIATHNPELAGMCDRILHLVNGQLRAHQR